ACARQLAGNVMSSRSARPRQAGSADSRSMSLTPMREGEGDDLAGIGGVRKDLLISGHRGVEADLPDDSSESTETLAPEHRAIVEDKHRLSAHCRRELIAQALHTPAPLLSRPTIGRTALRKAFQQAWIPSGPERAARRQGKSSRRVRLQRPHVLGQG